MKHILLKVFTLMTITSLAQKPSSVLKSHAFMRQHFAGTIAVDESGNPLTRGVDTTYLIYLETKGANVQWHTAWIDGRPFTATLVQVTDGSVEVGVRSMDDRKVVVRPAKGNQLWQVTLEPANMKKVPADLKKYKGDVILEGGKNKQKCYYPLKLVMLQEMPSV